MPVKWSLDCCRSKKSSEDAEVNQRSREIDKQLAKEKAIMRREVKLLLLGAGESGKSTFLKQMKIIHGFEFDRNQLEEYRSIIFSNVIKGMKVLLDARIKLLIPWTSEISQSLAESVFFMDDSFSLDPQNFCSNAPLIEKLWSEPAIKTAFSRRSEYQLSDSVRYFFDCLPKLSKPDYLPSTLDILHCRRSTKGIAEYRVTINDVPFRFVDVGGQRSQRQKWFQCFDSVTSILFLISSSEYDQVLLEDRQTNRIIESLMIFGTIVNHKAFWDVSIILFLNKTDLLKQKLNSLQAAINANENNSSNKSSLKDSKHQFHQNHHSSQNKSQSSINLKTYKDYFPDFDGDPFSSESIQNHMLTMFKNKRLDMKKPIYHHFTTAIDTENIKYVFNDVRNTILQKNITALMLN